MVGFDLFDYCFQSRPDLLIGVLEVVVDVDWETYFKVKVGVGERFLDCFWKVEVLVFYVDVLGKVVGDVGEGIGITFYLVYEDC